MSDRDRFQALMLEHLYGLLDADEARELEAFLGTPEGADLRTRAEAWKDKLAGAARLPFPNIQFAPPPPRLSPTVRPAREEPRPTLRGVWVKWAVAAAVLLVVGGLGGPAAYQFVGWQLQSRETDQLRLALDTRHKEVQTAEAERATRAEQVRREHQQAVAAQEEAAKAFRQALANAKKAIEDRDFLVRLTGPDRAIPGAPNEWKVETVGTRDRAARPSRVEVAVKDGTNTELTRETFDHSPGPQTLKLPASLWEKVAPGSDLFLEVAAYTDDNRRSVLAERLPLARPVYVTHLVTDKPLYRPGEEVRFRSLTLDRATFLPPDRDLHLEFQLKKPDGGLANDATVVGNSRAIDRNGLSPIVGPDGKPVRGIGVGEYELPPDAPGGEYVLEVVEVIPGQGNVPTRKVVLDTRRFLVNHYVPDVFEKKLEFDGKSYGPGDMVRARIEVTRTAGGPMRDARADVVASIDGKPAFFTDKDIRFRLVGDPATRQVKAVADLRFLLPADLYAGRGPKDRPLNAVLSVRIKDTDTTETILRPIPLVEKELRVEFYPEGGDLVEGVPSRVYFQVRTPTGKAADLKGTITDGTDTVAEVATLTDPEQAGVNRGLGLFTLTPRAGKRYFLKLSSPSGIIAPTKDGFPLPDVKPDGVALTSLDEVTEKAQPIRVRLETGKGPKVLHVGAYARGRLIGHRRVEVAAGKPVEVGIQGDASAAGVTRVTVFEEPKARDDEKANLIPRAERLVFRRPTEQLVLSVSPNKPRYSPGGRVALDIAARNEKDEPVPAILLVAVVNQSVIAMADNKTDRLMPTHFLLAGEVRNPAELEHADFLLTDHPKAGIALDMLLGTQGWRRFAEQNVFPADPNDRREVERMLVAHGGRTGAPFELFKLEEQRLSAEYQPKLEQAALRTTQAEDALANFRTTEEQKFAAEIATAKAREESARQSYTASAAELFQFETRVEKIRNWALPTFLLGLIALAAGGIAFALARKGRERRPYVVATSAALALAVLVVVGIVETLGTPAAERAWVETRQRDFRYGPYSPVPQAVAKGDGPAGIEPAAPGIDKEPPPVPVRGKDEVVIPAPQKLTPKALAERQRQAELAKKGGGRPAGTKRGSGPHDRDREQMDRVTAAIARAEQAPGGPLPAAEPPFVVREYAHLRDPSLGAGRLDHTETVFWHPVLVMPESGRTRVEFQLSDDVARYRVLVAGHTTDGRIGAVTKTIEAHKPFTVDPKLPAEISSADVVDVPVRIVNDSDDRRAVSFALSPTNLAVEGPGLKTPEGRYKEVIDLAPNGKGRRVYRVRPTVADGQATLGVVGTSDPAAEPDATQLAVRVVPDGYPVTGSFSDLLEKRATGSIELPKDLVKGTLKVRLEVYPTTLADLVKGLDGLLREPGGCFEQSSSSNYPNALVLDYLNQTNQANPEAAKRARELLDRGYAKLAAFECPDTPSKSKQGFEWFGAPDRAHEALTAYGLLQFKDMARVHPVDPDLIKRTQTFLLSHRDGQGGFQRNSKALDQFGAAPKHTTDAYILWALVESDPDNAEKLDLTKEIAALKAEALNEGSRGGKDAYFVALTANVLLQRGDREAALKLLDRLREKHQKGGVVTGAETSITRSRGRDLEIETTAVAMLGWLRANEARYAVAVKDATRWIVQQRGGAGGFGSTQSTILALKALVLHARKNAHPAEAGEIKVLVSGKPIATRRFTEADVEVIAIDVPNAEELFPVGVKTPVEIVTDAKHPYPFALSYTATTRTPASSDKCAVRIATKLGRAEATEGETVPLTVTLENRQKEGQGMAVTVVGLPAGLKVPTDLKQLTDLREKGVVSFFEVRGRELVLYWRELAPEQMVTVTVDVVCEVPGEYRGPASRGYLYYASDDKHWAEPLAIRVKPMSGPETTVAQK
jgi:alpha-2-macroglobulin-like protein